MISSAKKTRNQFLLAFAALIWGVAFVAQREGGDIIGPWSFTCVRSFLGAIILIPVIMLLDKTGKTHKKPQTRRDKKMLVTGGICCGIVLFVASNLQQVSLALGTTAGKSGFLTACYSIIVPILGLFFGKRCGLNIWCGVGLSLCGLYLLCINGELSFQFSDLLALACAFGFAIHIMTIDYFSPIVDGVRMSCIQFFVCGLLSCVPMIIFESGLTGQSISAWLASFASLNAWIPLLYAGFLSSGVAFTLQIVGQEGVNPTIASLLMSLESVFSVLAGCIILGEMLSVKEIIGCVLIFTAVVLSQLPPIRRKNKNA